MGLSIDKKDFERATELRVDDRNHNQRLDRGDGLRRVGADGVEHDVAWDDPGAQKARSDFVASTVVAPAGKRLQELGEVLGNPSCPRHPIDGYEAELRQLMGAMQAVIDDGDLSPDVRRHARLVLSGLQVTIAGHTRDLGLGKASFVGVRGAALEAPGDPIAWSAYAQAIASVDRLNAFTRRMAESRLGLGIGPTMKLLRPALEHLGHFKNDTQAQATLYVVVQDLQARGRLEARDRPIVALAEARASAYRADPARREAFERAVESVTAQLRADEQCH